MKRGEGGALHSLKRFRRESPRFFIREKLQPHATGKLSSAEDLIVIAKKVSPARYRFCKLYRREKALTDMTKILSMIVISMTFVLSSCEWFGPAEKYKTESGRTTYRSAEETPADNVTPAPQNIPGESKKN